MMEMKLGCVMVACTILATAAEAQWLDFPAPGTPRTRDGKPNLSARTPHAMDGHPDLSGTWLHEKTSVDEMRRLYGNELIDDALSASVPGMEIGTQHKYGFNVLIDFKPEDSPLRPEAKKIMLERQAKADATRPCSEIGTFPLMGLLSEPIKIVQAPKMTVVFYELDNMNRQIYTDGRKLPKEFSFPSYMGYSAGHWEREVFVIETAGFNDKAGLDAGGTPRSESMRVTERFHRRDFGHLDVETTFDDPVTFTRPFTIKVGYELLADSDIFEMFCNENEKDAAHLRN